MTRISRIVPLWYSGLTLGLTVACSPASLVEVAPPSGVVDASVIATPSGATQLMNAAINTFAQMDYGGTGNPRILRYAGLITDELHCHSACFLNGDNFMDARIGIQGLSDNTNAIGPIMFGAMSQARNQARQAREALLLYGAATPKAWLGRLYAFEAFSIVLVADLFCSGMPLSTVSFTGAVTPTAGFTTAELYAASAVLFDSGIVAGADSARFVYLASVGKARALLQLGRFADAAAAVRDVPTVFVYPVVYGASDVNDFGNSPRGAHTVDNEGTNGLIWSTDPRTAIVTTPALSSGMPYSAKYSKTSGGMLDPTQTITDNPIWLASGVEARLIEAEADLATGGTNWLQLLNTLRSTCVGTAPCAPVPGLTAASLPTLTDPGSADARLNLVIRERAMWLFLTGHRQGDMRRLVRVYHRATETVWPTGTYVSPGFAPLITASSLNGSLYGTAVVFSPEEPRTGESINNPLYTGCFNSDP